MKIVVIKGSSRKNSRSNQVIDQILSEVDAKEVVYILNQINLKGCTGCKVCKTANRDCIVNDDIKSYWQEVREADVVVIGSPNYMGSISGQVKQFLDRHYCLTDIKGQQKLNNIKKIFLIIGQGYEDKKFYEEEYNRIAGIFANQLNHNVDLIVTGGHNDIIKDQALQGMIKNHISRINTL